MAIGLNLAPAADAALNSTDPKTAARFAKTKDTAQDFEAMFLHSMFQQMFANVGQGPFSGGPCARVWRSFLTDEYSKSFAKTECNVHASTAHRALLPQH